MAKNALSSRAILLVNLGSPNTPSANDVKSYLNQFLMDPYVLQLPWLLRRLLVSLLILPTRPKESAKAYQSIWQTSGSPLIVLSQQLQKALQKRLDMPVLMAMRYGQPSIEQQLLQLSKTPEINDIVMIPLYPHYADSTVKTSIAEANRVVKRHKLQLKIQVQPPFFQHSSYITALVNSAKSFLEQDFDHLLFSYHGLPEIHIKRADPTGKHCLQHPDCCTTPSTAHQFCYRHQVQRTTECFVQRTGLSNDQYSIAFQSRLGRAKWLEPSTEDCLRILAHSGVKKLLVICPAFVTDCLETLEEIEIRGQQVFLDAGGESFKLIPCLNNNPEWVSVIENWCLNITAEES